MLAHTDLVISAWDGSRLVGFGRVLTDYVFRASIWDVIVDRDYQGQKIGTEIVRRILDHPTLQHVELFWLCTRRPGFYERLGFSAKEQTGMVWSRKNSGSQAWWSLPGQSAAYIIWLFRMHTMEPFREQQTARKKSAVASKTIDGPEGKSNMYDSRTPVTAQNTPMSME